MTRRWRLVVLMAVALGFSTVHAADEADRLISLARVWAAAKYLDPDLATGRVDWDAALIHAIPAVRAATTDDELAAAIDAMLRETGDPATRVSNPRSASQPAATEAEPFRLEGEVLIVRATAPDFPKAKGLVVDLRGAAGGEDEGEALMASLRRLSATRLSGPSWRYVMHSGYPPQTGTSSGGYYSAFIDVPGNAVAAAKEGPVPDRIAFVVDADTTLPDAALALRDAGRAIIVSAAPVDARVTSRTLPLTLDATHIAMIRVGAIAAPVASDIVAGDPLAAAVRFASGSAPAPARAGSAAPPPSTSPVFPPEPEYAEMVYPDVDYRLLAAIKLWSVIHYFYPYTALIDDWDTSLRDAIPQFIAAKDADDYARAVLALDARVEDGHSYAWGHPSLATLFGVWNVPFGVRYIEGRYVVVKTSDREPLVHVGDVILGVDGEALTDRITRLWPYFTASTEPARRARVAGTALRGAKDSVASLELREAKGVRRVEIPRVAPSELASTNPSYKILEGNIGYVDLTRLTVPQVDAMFDTLMKTKAIIFDMRGYPKGTAWSIAPRINTRGAKVGAQFRRRQFSGATTFEESESGFFFEQPLYPTDKPLYRGKTVTLIDERAISQAEHTCLFLEAASGTTFVGSPTAGANGDVTNFPLPGGFHILFTGHDVRHADGRQLQRKGIQPDIPVTPTIDGLRAGRDEVLERAVRFVNTGK